MATVNKFVKEVVQGSLNRKTPDRMVPATGDQDSLSDGVEELISIVDGIHNLKAAPATIELGTKQDQGCRTTY
jgi:hypothetical protein